MSACMKPERRTKRRYAYELYPHGGEFESRPLEIEVPYLYAQALGCEVDGTGWFEVISKESAARTMRLLNARLIALMADAMHQGLTGQDAWLWADGRMNPEGDFIYERAKHYGVDPLAIKPYPCGPRPNHHDHIAPEDERGWRTVTRVSGAEQDCEECTEPIEVQP